MEIPIAAYKDWICKPSIRDKASKVRTCTITIVKYCLMRSEVFIRSYGKNFLPFPALSAKIRETVSYQKENEAFYINLITSVPPKTMMIELSKYITVVVQR